jgi:hypothetical protein
MEVLKEGRKERKEIKEGKEGKEGKAEGSMKERFGGWNF